MREYLESASSSLIEVDLYHLPSRNAVRKADKSSIEFKASRKSSGVDLGWHPREELLKIFKDQRD